MRTIVLTLKDSLGRDVLTVPIATIDDRGQHCPIAAYAHRLVMPVEAVWVVATVEGAQADSLASDSGKEYSGEGEGPGGRTP